MIRLIELECPNCGAKLKNADEGEVIKCNHCGSEFLVDEVETKGTQKGTHTDARRDTCKKETGTGTSHKILPVLFCALLFVIGSIWFLSGEEEKESDAEPAFIGGVKEEGFTSEFFKEFVSEAYGMPYEKVAKRKLEELTVLRVFEENDCIVAEYAMSDGGIMKIELPDSLSVDYDDVKNFTGLKHLDIGSNDLSVEEEFCFSRLEEIQCGNSPEELLTMIEKPKNVKGMGCYRIDSILKVDQFANLEHLYVESPGIMDKVTDISALGGLKKLKKLQLMEADGIADFGVLYSLTELEELAIDSEGLKDVSFLQKMTSLKSLSIQNSIVLDISAVGELTSLTELRLIDNYDIRNYDVLESLKQLENLTLKLPSGSRMPETGNWTKLKKLSISGAEDIGFLSELSQLEELEISGCDCSNYEAISSLQGLKTLKLSGIYGDIYGLDVLTKLGNLKNLDISSMRLYGNAEVIFGIPALEELNINDCSFGLDFEAMPENENLRVLHMDRLELWENISVFYDGAITYLDYDEVALDDHMSFVSKFSNLEELYLQSNKLTDVEFVKDITELRKLDITGNYITDLRPLGSLKHLEIVWCGENAISQGTDLLENVIVITDSKSVDDWW